MLKTLLKIIAVQNGLGFMLRLSGIIIAEYHETGCLLVIFGGQLRYGACIPTISMISIARYYIWWKTIRTQVANEKKNENLSCIDHV